MFSKIKNIFLILLLTISIFTIFALINKYNDDEIIPTMASPDISSYLKEDLNGDGTQDILYIVSKNNKYYLQALINNQIYYFNEKRPLNSLGCFNEYAPLSINFLDLSRDKIPEIILQSFDDENTPIQHIFSLIDNKFIDIFCSTNNIIGILNSKNNKTPEYISLNSNDIDKSLSKHILNKKAQKNISYEPTNLKILEPILKFTKYLSNNTNFEDYTTESLLDSNIHQTFYKYFNENIKISNTYSLLDIYFTDTDWNMKSEPIKFNFKLRFKEISVDKQNSLFVVNLDILKSKDQYIISNIY